MLLKKFALLQENNPSFNGLLYLARFTPWWLDYMYILSVYLALYQEDFLLQYTDVITGAIASQITSLTIVYSTVYSDADQRKYQSSASLAFVWRIHRGPVNSPHKVPVTRKMFPFDDVIMRSPMAMTLLWHHCGICDHHMLSKAKSPPLLK